MSRILYLIGVVASAAFAGLVPTGVWQVLAQEFETEMKSSSSFLPTRNDVGTEWTIYPEIYPVDTLSSNMCWGHSALDCVSIKPQMLEPFVRPQDSYVDGVFQYFYREETSGYTNMKILILRFESHESASMYYDTYLSNVHEIGGYKEANLDINGSECYLTFYERVDDVTSISNLTIQYCLSENLLYIVAGGNAENDEVLQFSGIIGSKIEADSQDMRVDTTTPFSLTSEFEGKTYAISGESTVPVSSIRINPSVSVAVNLSAHSGGEVLIILPREMINGIFTISAEGKDIEFEKLEENDESTTIKFNVPSGTESVVVYGAEVIPELGSALVIITMIFTGLIFLSRSTGRSYHKH